MMRPIRPQRILAEYEFRNKMPLNIIHLPRSKHYVALLPINKNLINDEVYSYGPYRFFSNEDDFEFHRRTVPLNEIVCEGFIGTLEL